MVKKIITRSLMTFGGAVIGLIGGLVIGAALGAVGWLIILARTSGNWGFTWIYFGGGIGGLAGLVTGAGTGLLGVRTRLGLEWPIILLVGVVIGSWIMMGSIEAAVGMTTVGVLGALSGWLGALVVRKILGNRLPRGSVQLWVLAGYLAATALIAFAAPRLMWGLRMGLG